MWETHAEIDRDRFRRRKVSRRISGNARLGINVCCFSGSRGGRGGSECRIVVVVMVVGEGEGARDGGRGGGIRMRLLQATRDGVGMKEDAGSGNRHRDRVERQGGKKRIFVALIRQNYCQLYGATRSCGAVQSSIYASCALLVG